MTVRDRKALYLAENPRSFFQGPGPSRAWQTVVEQMRTWIVERHFQIPPLLIDCLQRLAVADGQKLFESDFVSIPMEAAH